MISENLEQRTGKESKVLRPLRRALNSLRPEKVVLDEEQYCHVFNRFTGVTHTVEGPYRRELAYDEVLVGDIEDKVVVSENGFAVINNPVEAGTSNILYGHREVRIGPTTFSLHLGEKLEEVRSEYVLTKYNGLLVKTLRDFEEHVAGSEFLVEGPKVYVPSKNEEVVKEVAGIPLSDTEGIYVQDRNTGDTRLVKGTEESLIYFLKPNEQLFEKELTKDELAGLGLREQTSREGVRVLTRQAANNSYLEDKSNALVLELEENEIVNIYDGSDVRIERGPKTTFLGPYERPKVLTLSGGKPIKDSALKVALLKLGPDFIYDRISVRTNDNAQLNVDVTYKWKFDLDDDELQKAFNLEDFVGYAAETLSSEIRSAAAQHDFEDFHAKSLEYAKEAIFGNGETRKFEENGLEIFGVDITAITPRDPEIADKLHEAIKQNMDIYCNRLVQSAKIEAEKQEVDGKMKIAETRNKLIQKELENRSLEALGDVKIQTETEAQLAQSKAASYKIKHDARLESEQKRLETVITELGKDGGDRYLELQRIGSFADTEKLVVVPTDSKLVLPFVKGAVGGLGDG